MGASWRIRPIEWQIAWRHLRAGESAASWVGRLTLAALFLVAVGLGFAVYAGMGAPEAMPTLGPAGGPGESALSPEQQAYGSLGGATMFAGGMLLVFAIFARFFNLLATIITYSVLLGCMALVIVLSLMSGLEGVLRDQILSQRAHMLVSPAQGRRFAEYEDLVDQLEAVPQVAGASPYLEGEIMARTGLNRQGALLIGIIPDRLTKVSTIDTIIKEGRYDSLTHPEDIPQVDPFSFTREETPWRLRHLDDDEGGSSLRPRRNPATTLKGASDQVGKGSNGKIIGGPSGVQLSPEVEDVPPEPLPGVEQGIDEDVDDADPPVAAPLPLPVDPDAAIPGGPPLGISRGLGMGTDGLLPRLPPPPALPGPRSGTGSPEPDPEGWEDPVHVLGLGSEANPNPASGSGAGSADGPFGDGDWEDPEEILGLEAGEGDPAADPDGLMGSGPAVALEPSIKLGEDAVVDPILIGRELAMELAVHVGADVQLITPVGRMTPAGRFPGKLATRVGGVFFSGMYEYDRKNVYAPLDRVQAFLHSQGRISGVEIKLHDINDLGKGKIAVEAALTEAGRDDLKVETWQELNANLFSAMFLEKIAMFVALMFVVLVASFGILASNLMSVLEKAKEIAILKAMGATDSSIQRVFVAEGLCVGMLGAISGILIGLALCYALDNFGLPISENLSYMGELPVVVNPKEVALVGVAALVIVWLSSLYPAGVASRMRPVDGLRHAD